MDFTTEFGGLDSDQVPEHTCKRDKTNTCPRCTWMSEQFALLFPAWLARADHAVHHEAGQCQEHAEELMAIIEHLTRAALAPLAWWHAVNMCVQLEGAPVKVERDRWQDVIDAGHGNVLDIVSTMFVDGLRPNAGHALNATFRTLTGPEIVIVYTVLGTMAFERYADKMSVAQRAAFSMLLHDGAAGGALSYPRELLMAARVTGAAVEQNPLLWAQLMNQASLHGYAASLLWIWLKSTASYLPPGEPINVMVADPVSGEACVLSSEGDLGELPPEQQGKRGSLLCLKLTRAIADGQKDVEKMLVAEIGEDVDLAQGVLRASSFMYAAFVRDMLAEQGEGDAGQPHAAGPPPPGHTLN